MFEKILVPIPYRNARVLRCQLGLIALLILLVGCDRESQTALKGDGNRPADGASAAPTEEPVYRYNQLLRQDSIYPVYEPEFVAASAYDYPDEQLVLGVEINGVAKAYPIVVLNHREMVNDELAGIPILATW